MTAKSSEVQGRADFSRIRYAQVWEDADILLDGLRIRPGDVCLSIASAGDNALAMLLFDPARVVALDLNPAQIACVELRIAAYRYLEHPELLALIGDPSPAAEGEDAGNRRGELYRRCRESLSEDARAFWDARPEEVAAGIGSAGKFERYFALFRTRILPLVHSRATVGRLLAAGSGERERVAFYDSVWNNWRWRLLFRVFFSRTVMGRFGRDPEFFKYVEGSVSNRILQRVHHALTVLDPAQNPYLQWILTGRHVTALPLALRPESFDTIRARLDRLELRCQPLEAYLDEVGERAIDRFNLSDIFEYMSPESYEALLERLARAGRPGGRLAYWNMLAPRRRPPRLADRLRPLTDEETRLHRADKAFFYSAFVLEEVLP